MAHWVGCLTPAFTGVILVTDYGRKRPQAIYTNMDIARPDLARKKKAVKFLLISGAAGVLGILAVIAAVLAQAPPSVERKSVLIDTVRRGTFVRSVRGSGKLIPSQTRLAVARTDATVDRILVHAGSTVQADSVVLALLNPIVEERLQTANAAFSAAKSDHIALRARLQTDMFTIQSELAEVRGDFEIAKIHAEAGLRGYELGVLSEVEYRRTKISADQFQERLKLAEQRVRQFQHNLDAQIGASDARLAQLEDAAEIRSAEADSLQVQAGMGGILQRVEVEEGQRVTTGQTLVRVAGPEGLIAELFIPESQATQVRAGLPASIQVANQSIAGRVLRVDPAVSQGAVRVEISLTSGLPPGSRPEQSIEGSVVLGEVPEALFVGRPVNTAGNGAGSVYKLIDSNTAELTYVQFGAESVTDVQILSGLDEGDVIVLSDLGSLQNSETISLD